MSAHRAAAAPYAKAIVAAVVSGLCAGLAVLYGALDDGGVTAQEWIGIALAALGGSGLSGAATYRVPNRTASQ